MVKHAIIDQNNQVVNVVISPLGQFRHPQGYIVIEANDVKISDIYNAQDASFSRE